VISSLECVAPVIKIAGASDFLSRNSSSSIYRRVVSVSSDFSEFSSFSDFSSFYDFSSFSYFSSLASEESDSSYF